MVGLALLVGVGLVAATAVVLWPRWQAAKRRADVAKHREIRRALGGLVLSGNHWEPTGNELARFPDQPHWMTRLVDRLVEEYENVDANNNRREWLRAFELWAVEPEPRDSAPLERLVKWSRDTHLRDVTRLELLYLVEELKQPTFAAARDLPDDYWISGTNVEALAALRALAPIDVDSGLEFHSSEKIDAIPARALAQIAQALQGDLVHENGRFRIKKHEVPLNATSVSLDAAGVVLAAGSHGSVDAATIKRLGSELDPAWGPASDWIEIDSGASGVKWFLLGRQGATLCYIADLDMEPLKCFRALAALRGLTPPRKIAEHVYETFPVSAETRR